MEIKIEKGVPLPSVGHDRRPSKYPIKDMQVGDSFFVPLEDDPIFTRARQTIYVSARRCGVKVAVRKKEAGLRVWRVA